ncbi:MAG: glycoside hydrolase family 38 C-terminal domain-containing protein [Bacteroides sp.]|jgi:hypothetical protein|nr:glycoside hydrolase family 38 C-terminal domain-containing protein [Bacteroides sp.]
MKSFAITLIQLFLIASVIAQGQGNSGNTIVNGYQEKIAGVDFSYHSSVQAAKESLLARATDGNSFVEWKTAAVPEVLNQETVTFVWLAGIGSSPGLASFDVAVNGQTRFTFHTDGSEAWNLEASDGSSLSFKSDFIDQHGDRFGFMYLSIPAVSLKLGEPLTLRVTGSNSGKTSWYMTFKFPLQDGLNFRALPAISILDGKEYQLGIAGIFHFGGTEKAKIFINNSLLEEREINFGYNHVRVNIPAVTQSTTVDYRLEIGDKTWQGELQLHPVRQWKVNFVHHTHTDIGYTRSQTDILAEHLRYIDYALDYCDMTDDFPGESQFRWTNEASWAVDEYLKSRPRQQVDRLLQRIKEGRIEVTAMYFNFSELPDEQTLAASLQPLGTFREHGIAVKTAMQNDVNGIGWSLIDHYSDMGVKYLNMGTHGHRALICFDKPTLFWWESPSGKRMLAFRGEHYMIGNTFAIHGEDFTVFEEELLSYLLELEAKGYEYDQISIQHSGFITDNSPPSIASSKLIRQWNEKYSWPRLSTSTATAFFEEMEQRHGDDFMVIRGAWPDWWTDGFGASAREVAATRVAQGDLRANAGGLAMAAINRVALPDKIADRMEAINTALLFYTEHTVGFSESVREPTHRYTMEQRAIKESYAWEASRRAKMLGEETMGLLQSFFQRQEKPSLLIFNTLNWNRSGLFTTYIDYQVIPRDAEFSLMDADGNQAFAQVTEKRSDGAYYAIWAEDIPAFGYKRFSIRVEDIAKKKVLEAPLGELKEMENDWYQIVIDPEKGAITSLFDKELGLEMIDSKAEWKLGEFIYELLDNREQMEAFKLDNYSREPLDELWIEAYEEGEVWITLRFRGNTSAATGEGAFSFEIRLFNTTKRIDLAYFIDKKLVTEPEGVYVAFPFVLEDGQLAFDVPGGEIRAGIDQISGSSNDWNTVQTYARLYNEHAQILLSSVEIPLMQFGGINTGRYTAGAVPETTHIYGWPMNNYWTTNFNADQRGGLTWQYSLTSRPGNSLLEATHFGWDYRTPFLSRVLPGGGRDDDQNEGVFLTGWPENILLVSVMPDQDGQSALFHVREIEGNACNFTLSNPLDGATLNAVEVDVTGYPVNNGSLELNPLESKFFRVDF